MSAGMRNTLQTNNLFLIMRREPEEMVPEPADDDDPPGSGDGRHLTGEALS